MSLTSTTVTRLATKAIDFDEIAQNNGYYAFQGHSMSPVSVSMRSPYATRMSNSNLLPILKHFRDIVDYWSNFEMQSNESSF